MSETIRSAHSSALIRVVASDGCRFNSQLIAMILEQDQRLQVLDTGPDPREIVASVIKERPAVALISAEIDGNPHQGFQVAREIRALRTRTRVVMLLDSSCRNSVVEAFRAGAYGVISRSESLANLAKCVLCVSEGQVWANSQELEYLLQAFGETSPPLEVDTGSAVLSRREQDVARCVAEGLSNREIAQRLGLTEHTVKNYLCRMYSKLGVCKRIEVALYACGLLCSSRARRNPKQLADQRGLLGAK